MSEKKRRFRPVHEWYELVQQPNGSFIRKLNEIYSNRSELVKESTNICLKSVQVFGETYGWDKNIIIVRSTGRINLLGMHIEHRGGAINTVAIKELFFLAEPRNDDVVVMKNVDSDKFPDEKFRIQECLPSYKIEDWDAWCHDEFEKRKNNLSVTWSIYIRAAILHLQHYCTAENREFNSNLRGMNIVVHSNIPQAAGLSSSSALVVAAAEASIYINNMEINDTDFIDICGYGEWYVGTRGGLGDHSAIKFGQPNSILHINFFPLRVKSLPLPKGYSIILANSLVEAHKKEGARNIFNNRVASYTLGLMLIKKSFPDYARKLTHLRDLNQKTLGVDDIEIYKIIKSLPESITRNELSKNLPECQSEVHHIFRSHVEPDEGYKIRQVCMYGIAECSRSDMAVNFLEKGDIVNFGELINISHDGDRVTHIVNSKRVPINNNYSDDKSWGYLL